MKIEKVRKLVVIWHDKKEYIIHIKNLKHALNHGLVFIFIVYIKTEDIYVDIAKNVETRLTLQIMN